MSLALDKLATIWAMIPGQAEPRNLLVLEKYESGLIKTREPGPAHRVTPVWIDESWIVPAPAIKRPNKSVSARIEEMLVKYPRNRSFTAGQIARILNINSRKVKGAMFWLVRSQIVESIRTTIVGRLNQPPDRYRISPNRKRRNKRKRNRCFGMRPGWSPYD